MLYVSMLLMLCCCNGYYHNVLHSDTVGLVSKADLQQKDRNVAGFSPDLLLSDLNINQIWL